MAYQDPDDGVERDCASSVEPTSPDSDVSLNHSLESSFSSVEFEEGVHGNAAESLVGHICWLHDALDALPSLIPSRKVNQLFSDLVSSCLDSENEKCATYVLEDARIQRLLPRLRQLCSTGESELESYWAQRLSKTFDDVLAVFAYFTNYRLISQVEASLIRDALPSTTSQPQHIAFIGSGPLPLTSLLLAETHFPTAKITNIDNDCHALALSQRLSQHLRLEQRIRTLQADAASVPAAMLKQCDVVYLAALVGMSAREKTAILRSVACKLKEESILVARSAHGLRRLLYPVLDVGDLDLSDLGLGFLTEWVPRDDEIVNSVLVFRKLASTRYVELPQN